MATAAVGYIMMTSRVQGFVLVSLTSHSHWTTIQCSRINTTIMIIFMCRDIISLAFIEEECLSYEFFRVMVCLCGDDVRCEWRVRVMICLCDDVQCE